MARRHDPREFAHERLGAKFEEALNDYDTARRVNVLVDVFLTDLMLRGKRVLDVGSGLGFVSQRLVERGAEVTAVDLGPNLVQATRRRAGCHAEVADALALIEHFGPNRFDAVVSSECIEHTPDPSEALRQMVGVLKPGGFISLSTPNVVWYPAVRLATVLKLRPFDGYENFISWGLLRSTLREAGCSVRHEFGLHLFPFQFGLHPLSTWCDMRLQALRPCMVNMCVMAQKL